MHVVHKALRAVYNENFRLQKFNDHAKFANQPESDSHVEFIAHGAMNFLLCFLCL